MQNRHMPCIPGSTTALASLKTKSKDKCLHACHAPQLAMSTLDSSAGCLIMKPFEADAKSLQVLGHS